MEVGFYSYENSSASRASACENTSIESEYLEASKVHGAWSTWFVTPIPLRDLRNISINYNTIINFCNEH